MEIIRSAENKLVKKINKLKQKKYRDEYGEFIVEGYKNVIDSIAADKNKPVVVVLSEKNVGIVDEFRDCDTAILSDALFEKICDTESGQGFLSVHKIPKSAFPESDGVILLDRVRDPGNVGTILRTAVAAGYDAVTLNSADVYSPKTVRSAMSAVLKCRIGTDIGISELRARGYEIICADMHGENVFECEKPKGKYCVVIGNEADGICDEIKCDCDRTLSIPLRGDIESLNAAVAAGIIMYALNN